MKYGAKWILPIEGDPIENGSIEIKDGKIVKISRKSNGKVLDLGEGIIMPALINSHTHLEMPKIDTVSQSGFMPWLDSFLKSVKAMHKADFQIQLQKNERKSAENGTCLVCDITNHEDLRYSSAGFSFYEQIGWDSAPIKEIRSINNIVRCYAAHAIYSTSPAKIKATYDYNTMRGLPWSIHLAESNDEIEFCSGKGKFIDFWKDAGNLKLIRIPHLTPALYLDKLGVLGKNSILVHAVHLSEKELDLIAQRGSTICVCPRSNEHIGVGKAGINRFLKRGINVVAGTDSLLSNKDLNMIKEIEYIVENFGIKPETAIKFATSNAGIALDRPFGILKEGYCAPILFFEGNASDPYEIMFNEKNNSAVRIIS